MVDPNRIPLWRESTWARATMMELYRKTKRGNVSLGRHSFAKALKIAGREQRAGHVCKMVPMEYSPFPER